MAKLIARAALGERLPFTRAGLTVTAVETGPVSHIAPLKGQATQVDEALGALGLGWPAPGEVRSSEAARVLWMGREAALLIGAEPPIGLEAVAAVSDQTGANAVVRVEGPGVEDMLARLVPVDLRPAALPEDRTVRTLVGHMAASVTRTGDQEIEIIVMRSMAGTLIHDLTRAIDTWSART